MRARALVNSIQQHTVGRQWDWREIDTINPVSNYRAASRTDRHRSCSTYQRSVPFTSYLLGEIRDVFSIADVERAQPAKRKERETPHHTLPSYPFFDGRDARCRAEMTKGARARAPSRNIAGNKGSPSKTVTLFEITWVNGVGFPWASHLISSQAGGEIRIRRTPTEGYK